jgi:hypothetical protein
MRSGRVACWGKNDEGQLGDGTRKDRQDAVWVDGLDHAVDHAVGSHHVCALENDEQVVCWGSNDHGQLGTRGGSRTRPVRVPNVSGASDIVSGLGARQTCAILPGRDVLCWGSWGNRRTEVGAQRLNLEPLPDSSTAVEIAVTPHQICGRRSGDTTVCWDRAEDSGKAGPVYGPPTPAFEGHEVHRLTGGSFRMLGQTDDTTLVLRSRTLGSLNPDAVFSVSGPVPP